MYNSIRPGKPWLDANGNRIQAHGAALFYENGTYYWYGENKEKTDGKSKTWTYGIRFYSSKDLYNWNDEGLVIPPDVTNKRSPLHPSKRIDRPHIIYNKRTKKYVCWLKEINRSYHLLTADRLLGPYTMVKPNYKPLGRVAGDFDLFQDETGEKGFLYFTSKKKCVYLAELTEDYLGVTGKYTTTYEGLYPPFTREGVTHLERNGKHFLLTSGMIGYIPNPSEYAISEDALGPYRPQGNPHIDDSSSASFNSQISYVFKHPTIPDLYIAMADRWVPEFVMTSERYELLTRLIASSFDKQRYHATMKEKMALLNMPLLAKANTSIADYVWLPITWNGEKLEFHWLDEWKIEDFAKQ